MNELKVKQVAELLEVSQMTVYKKIKRLKPSLKGLIIKKNRVIHLTTEAIEIIKKSINPREIKIDEVNNSNDLNQVYNSLELLNESFKQQNEYLKNQLQEKDKLMSQTSREKNEIINKLIDRQAESEEKLQTIIMKLTQDLDQTRKLIENKTTAEPKKEETKKTDKVISIKEFVETKVDKEIEKKKKNEDPLQGRPTLYKIYVKMFHPYKLRKRA